MFTLHTYMLKELFMEFKDKSPWNTWNIALVYCKPQLLPICVYELPFERSQARDMLYYFFSALRALMSVLNTYTSQLQGYVLLSSTRLCIICQELRVYYQLPVVGCVSLTSLSIACACPFGWGCALKTIAPILSVTIIFISLPISLFFCFYH